MSQEDFIGMNSSSIQNALNLYMKMIPKPKNSKPIIVVKGNNVRSYEKHYFNSSQSPSGTELILERISKIANSEKKYKEYIKPNQNTNIAKTKFACSIPTIHFDFSSKTLRKTPTVYKQVVNDNSRSMKSLLPIITTKKYTNKPGGLVSSLAVNHTTKSSKDFTKKRSIDLANITLNAWEYKPTDSIEFKSDF